MLKQLFDFLLALMLFIVLLPLSILLYLLIRIKLGAPVIYKQQRSGKDGCEFTIYKFRSMTDERDANGLLLCDSLRLTPFGQWLRKSSLDELPQLFNVLKGDISFVGPRALIAEYLPLYNQTQMRRHLVKPGITGWAQVNGRNALSWQEKFKLDVWYVDNQSFFLDIKILLMTFFKVFKSSDISHHQDITMPRFIGNKEEPLDE